MRYLLFVLAIFSLSACNKVAFSTPKTLAMKQSTITPTNGEHHHDGGTTTTTNNGGDKNPTASSTPNPGIPIVGNQIPISRLCSDSQSIKLGANIHSASSLELTVYKSSGENATSVVCTNTNTAQLKSDLEAGHITMCAGLTDGNYTVSILANGSTELVVGAGRNTFSINGGNENANIQILVDTNPNANQALGALLDHDPNIVCDANASPLYVDFRRSSEDVDFLSSPQNGVMFDILGANGSPAYHKSQISWFEKGKFALLTLPKAGDVDNIDQLFGNNTLGDDGEFADNGFLALAKYDDNHDGVIDSKDAVYSKLRLWFDVDRDAKAEKRELKTLAEMKVVAIDLDYDPNYSERDNYGNQVKLKSVVKFADGNLKPIFDLWFALSN